MRVFSEQVVRQQAAVEAAQQSADRGDPADERDDGRESDL